MTLNNSLLTIDYFKTAVVVFVLVFLAAGSAWAAAAPAPTQMAPAPQPGRTIFDYKAELKLTDKQEQDIRSILADLNKRLRLDRARLTLLDAEIEDLIEREADLGLIQKKLREAFDLQAAIRFADLEATRKINRVLLADQLKRWRGIQAAAREQAGR